MGHTATVHPAVPRCPGQDTRTWELGDIFEIPCPACGEDVELFKDDPSRPCSACGVRVKNPRVHEGCAQWCAHAGGCVTEAETPADRGDAPRTEPR